jgi:hypothetical protein
LPLGAGASLTFFSAMIPPIPDKLLLILYQ